MSACPFCEGSGEVVENVDVGAIMARQRVPCECRRDTIPTVPDNEEALCLAAKCHGCPECVPGYIP